MTQQDDIGSRLKLFLASVRVTQSAVSETLGVTRGFISQVINGNSKFSIDFLENLVKCFPTLNTNWLLTGEGEMIERRDKQSEEKEQTLNDPKAQYQLRPATSVVFENLMALFEDLERRIQALEQHHTNNDGIK